jgi:hypothetical protein
VLRRPGKIAQKVASAIKDLWFGNDAWCPKQGKDKKDAAKRQSASSCRFRPLNRQAAQYLDCSESVGQDLTVRKVSERLDLLPIVKVAAPR